MRFNFLLELRRLAAATLLFSATAACAQQEPCKPTVTGDLRIEHVDSNIFPGPHTLRIWLPPGYSEASNAHRTYPVLYMLDGQNIFDVCSSMFHSEWQVDETLTRLIEKGEIEPIIVVGIDSPTPDSRRTSELLPVPNPMDHTPFELHGQLFPSFLEQEVLPHIASAYRVRAGRASTAIGGSSYGAIAALYALLTDEKTFGLGLLESPSLQVGNGEFVRSTEHMFVTPLRVYVGVGDDEAGNYKEAMHKDGFDADILSSTFAHGAKLLSENLKDSGGDHIAVKFVEVPGARHTEESWRDRFPAAIEFLFPAAQPAAP